MVIISSPPGGGSHFLTSLFIDKSLYLYYPENNEYKVHVKPYPDGKIKKMQQMFYDGSRWTIKEQPRHIRSSISRMHPHTLRIIPNEVAEDVVNNTDTLYDIQNGEANDYINMLAAIKNRVCSHTIQPDMINYLNPKLHDFNGWVGFHDYCREFKKHNIPYTPLSISSLNYFGNMVKFDIDDFKEHIRKEVKEYISSLKQYKRHNFKNIIELDYTKLIIKAERTGTIFDQHREKIKEYHKTNVELLNRICGFYDIPVDNLL